MGRKHRGHQTLGEAAQPLKDGMQCRCPNQCLIHGTLTWVSPRSDEIAIVPQVQRIGLHEQCGGGRRIIRKD